ncbi:hypothetical protein [Kribbella pratensis]|uniref:hypothetical protein n=1 Tax=Kribbella pratensis TaxID=2512112 RepID=UPI001416EE87|nr:hypothetical protein [Kribbella pratensis]
MVEAALDDTLTEQHHRCRGRPVAQVGTAQRQRVEDQPVDGATRQYLSNCTQTSGLPNTIGAGIWEPRFLLTSNNTLACFISDERAGGVLGCSGR